MNLLIALALTVLNGVREGYHEVGLVSENDWKVIRAGRFKYGEQITAKEARAFIWNLELQLREITLETSYALVGVDLVAMACASSVADFAH
eukprot:11630510-Karenia_brevis.AAC.1